ncbi:MAG: hypothetical protein GX595_08575 [Lentisphaerae bacterium]|nr:hypothetical protein [Lentisphaerota bacterium]
MTCRNRRWMTTWSFLAVLFLGLSQCEGRLGQLPSGRDLALLLRLHGVLALVPAACHAGAWLSRPDPAETDPDPADPGPPT